MGVVISKGETTLEEFALMLLLQWRNRKFCGCELTPEGRRVLINPTEHNIRDITMSLVGIIGKRFREDPATARTLGTNIYVRKWQSPTTGYTIFFQQNWTEPAGHTCPKYIFMFNKWYSVRDGQIKDLENGATLEDNDEKLLEWTPEEVRELYETRCFEKLAADVYIHEGKLHLHTSNRVKGITMFNLLRKRREEFEAYSLKELEKPPSTT